MVLLDFSMNRQNQAAFPSLRKDLQILGVVVEHLAAVLCDRHRILEADAERPWQIDARLDGKHRPGAADGVGDSGYVRLSRWGKREAGMSGTGEDAGKTDKKAAEVLAKSVGLLYTYQREFSGARRNVRA